MDNYQIHCTVGTDDLDDLEHVNNVRYVQWIQDVSKQHWQKKAPKQIQEQVVWVVLTHHIEYRAAAVINDELLLRTHIKSSKGAKCTRIVEIFNDKTNSLLVRSSTVWCLLNRDTFKPTRISEEIERLFL